MAKERKWLRWGGKGAVRFWTGAPQKLPFTCVDEFRPNHAHVVVEHVPQRTAKPPFVERARSIGVAACSV